MTQAIIKEYLHLKQWKQPGLSKDSELSKDRKIDLCVQAVGATMGAGFAIGENNPPVMKPGGEHIKCISYTNEEINYLMPSQVEAIPPSPLEEKVSFDDFVWAIEEEPIEDGYTHDAEDIIKRLLTLDTQNATGWFKSKLLAKRDAYIASAIIKCLGRLSAGEVGDWGVELVQAALEHPDIEIRDNAVQALELWDTPEAIDLLRRHSEDVRWLQDYIERIIDERS